MENGMAPEKAKNIIHDPAIPLLCISKGNEINISASSVLCSMQYC
jgi:hypothetical protein